MLGAPVQRRAPKATVRCNGLLAVDVVENDIFSWFKKTVECLSWRLSGHAIRQDDTFAGIDLEGTFMKGCYPTAYRWDKIVTADDMEIVEGQPPIPKAMLGKPFVIRIPVFPASDA
jgi:hypothetical protein